MAMTQRDRAAFIYEAGREGLPIEVARKLLRYGTTLHRLAEAQCNGDWPYNGDRDRPSKTFRTCEHCDGTAKVAPRPWLCGSVPKPDDWVSDDCLDCQGTGRLQTNGRECQRWDSRYGVCTTCGASGVSRSVLLKGGICPDCRTTDAVKALLADVDARATGKMLIGWSAKFQGDPRGAVLRIVAPSGRELVAG